MGMRSIRGPLQYDQTKVMTSGASYVMTNEIALEVLKTSGSATAVTLPASPKQGRTVHVKDSKGDAATNNITVSPASGTIDGASSYVISANYAGVSFRYNGTEWGRVEAAGGAAAPGDAGSRVTIVKSITALDATDTTLFTITVPNVVASAGIRVTIMGGLGDGDSTDSAIYNIGVSRIAGAAAKAVAGAKLGTGATAGATGNAVVVITIPSVTGGVTAVNTFAVTAKVTRSAGSSTNHPIVAEIVCLNGTAGGVTVS